MNTAVIIFILAQLADILLTEYGMAHGIRELNPLGCGAQVIRLKLAATVFVAGFLEYNRFRLKWLVWLPGGIMYLVVVWNVINILSG